jgi:cobalt-zinc-cadmium efflux system outer membrane protein
LLGLLSLLASVARAEPTSDDRVRLTLASYLRQVRDGNLEAAAQRANVSIARAQIAVARVFPDLQITAGLQQVDVSQHDAPTSTIVQLALPVQLGGKRAARIDVAEAGLAVADADLEDYLRSLRGAAAAAYVDALHARLAVDRKRRTLASLEGLVAVNTERLRAGDIGESVLVQSRVEAEQFRAQVLSGEGEVKTADLALVHLLGKGGRPLMGKELDLEGDLRADADRKLRVEELVRFALANRPDLRSARRRVALAQRQIDLVRANRVIDVTLSATWQHSFPTSGPTPLPSSELVGGTLTVPIPFSRVYRGDLEAAYSTEDQSRILSDAAEVRVEVEVRQAVTKYEAAASRVKLYTNGVLSQADGVLERALYNYKRGGATLVEVLVAQRTVDEVYLSYYDALAEAARALVAVSQAAAEPDLLF